MMSADVLRPVTRTAPPWCDTCRHRGTPAFVDLTPDELAFMAKLKSGHAVASARATVIRQGEPLAQPLVLYSGWAARYWRSPTGERQLLSILLPGDLVSAYADGRVQAWFSVETLTEASFCRFDAERWVSTLMTSSIASRLLARERIERQRAEERFAVVAACEPRRALAHLLVDLHQRLRLRGLARRASMTIPISRKQLSQALGITTVHLHRVFKSFKADNVLLMEGAKVRFLDMDKLQAIAGLASTNVESLPLI